jgi:hypothetical protein
MHVGAFWDSIAALFALYCDDGPHGINMRAGFADRFTFAWEDNAVAKRAIELAESALEAAEVLVVIGYSFPAFNRLVDTRLMNAFQTGGPKKRLVIQNPSFSREDVLNLFELDEDGVDITVDANKDQFHLPNELFAGQG